MTEDNSQNFPESGIIQMKSTPLLSRYLPSLIMIIAGATLILSAHFFVPTSLADENLIDGHSGADDSRQIIAQKINRR